MPEYVYEEFRSFLKCGILDHGFIRLKCEDCNEEMVVAFSCKLRGFCPSCSGRRMAETAAHLVDHVLPHRPYRQFVVTFPFEMRHWMATHKSLEKAVHKIVSHEIHKLYQDKAGFPSTVKSAAGAVSFTQRWGSALNLNIHYHTLFTDGVYYNDDSPQFRNVKIDNQDIQQLLSSIVSRTIKLLRKRGFVAKEGFVEPPEPDPLFEDGGSLAVSSKAATMGRIAFGSDAGKPVIRIGRTFGYEGEFAVAQGDLCYSQNGFSIHARRHINSLDRKGLESLIRYISRGPISNERIEILDDGQVKLRLKSSYSDGTTHMVYSPHDFLAKLCALIPPPKAHLVRWSGCLAPASPFRRQVVLDDDARKGFQFDSSAELDGSEENKGKAKNYRHAELLKRVFKVDVETCDKCGGKMKYMAAILDPVEIHRYLDHEGLSATGPPCELSEEVPLELEYETLS